MRTRFGIGIGCILLGGGGLKGEKTGEIMTRHSPSLASQNRRVRIGSEEVESKAEPESESESEVVCGIESKVDIMTTVVETRR